MLKQRKKPSRWKCWLIIGAASGLLFFSGKLVLDVLLLMRYQSTQGKVLETRIEEVKNAKGGKSYRPIVEYQYAVSGIEYQNNIYTILEYEDRGNDDFANEVLTQYRPHAACTVYFNPSDPQTSVLLTRPTASYIGFFALTALLGSAHLFGGLLELKGFSHGANNSPGESD